MAENRCGLIRDVFVGVDSETLLIELLPGPDICKPPQISNEFEDQPGLHESLT